MASNRIMLSYTGELIKLFEKHHISKLVSGKIKENIVELR